MKYFSGDIGFLIRTLIIRDYRISMSWFKVFVSGFIYKQFVGGVINYPWLPWICRYWDLKVQTL